MMKTILYLYDKCKVLVAGSIPMSILRREPIFEKICTMKFDIKNDELDKFDDYLVQIDDFYAKVLKEQGK